MKCRDNCGMCCIEPSIKQGIPGMPDGKKAGEYCINLDPVSMHCGIWGRGDYPDFCRQFTPEPAFCGETQGEARQVLRFLEGSTHPANIKE